MNFIWHTALSVFDIGSSLIYSMLGRDLTESDVQLLGLLFAHMARTQHTLLSLPLAEQDPLSVALSRHIDSDRAQLQNFTSLLLTNLKSGVGKDLLLVTSKSNGYNLLQTSVQSSMELSASMLARHYKHFMLTPSLEASFSSLITLRLELVRILLETYACDPNRGLLLSNKTKLVVDTSGCAHAAAEIMKNTSSRDQRRRRRKASGDWLNKQRTKSRLDMSMHSFKSNQCFVDSDVNGRDSSNQEEKDHNEEEDEDDRKEAVQRLTVINKNQLNRSKSFNATPLKQHQQHLPVSNLVSSIGISTLHVDLATITPNIYLDEASLAELNATPIDTPLLLLTCVFNCHNLVHSENRRSGHRHRHQRSHKSKRTGTKAEQPSAASSSAAATKRRQTIHGLTNEPVAPTPPAQVKSNAQDKTAGATNGRKDSKTDSSVKSDLYSYWSSISSSKNNTNTTGGKPSGNAPLLAAKLTDQTGSSSGASSSEGHCSAESSDCDETNM